MKSETIPLSYSPENKQMSVSVKTTDIEEKTSAADPSVWVDLYGDCLFRFAFARLRDEAAAEDLVQETLLAAIQSLDKFAGGATERTWLISILKHKIIDYYRKNYREVQPNEEDTDLSGFDHFFKRDDEWDGHWRINLRPVEMSQTPETVLESAEFWAVMKNCLSALPARTAGVFALREMDGLSSEEICDVLCLSPNNFWVIMHRARMQLRTCIEFKWLRISD
jgi:RNA polymerase sigma-70 factor, ECF subfamily